MKRLLPAGWLRGEANPYPFDVFDYGVVTLTSVAVTADQAIAESFTCLRASDGKAYIDRLPE